MYIAQVSLRVETREQEEQAEDVLDRLTSAYRSNGQALGREFPTFARDGAWHAIVMMPARDSLEPQRANHWVNWAWGQIASKGFSEPTISVLGEAPDSASECACTGRASYILYTTFLRLESCLCCGDCFRPVPLYAVPATYDREYYDVLCWQSDYQACDQLQMGCSTGERFALREMSQVDSSLSQRGREICGKIEAGTGLPVFYYLHRYRGKSKRFERERRCPGCGEPWLLEEPLHELFDFQCSPCRLLSNIAFH
jgi:predicted  nucleic acid-binding Zn ribbon protein